VGRPSSRTIRIGFHGDNGAGLGASHQTGWTGVVAKLIELFGRLDGQQVLDAGKSAAFRKGDSTEIVDRRVNVRDRRVNVRKTPELI
jgi:hypothetical protein